MALELVRDIYVMPTKLVRFAANEVIQLLPSALQKRTVVWADFPRGSGEDPATAKLKVASLILARERRGGIAGDVYLVESRVLAKRVHLPLKSVEANLKFARLARRQAHKHSRAGNVCSSSTASPSPALEPI